MKTLSICLLTAAAACLASMAVDRLARQSISSMQGSGVTIEKAQMFTQLTSSQGLMLDTPAEHSYRLELFSRNVDSVTQLNIDYTQKASERGEVLSGDMFEVNHMSHLSDEEFRAQLEGLKLSEEIEVSNYTQRHPLGSEFVETPQEDKIASGLGRIPFKTHIQDQVKCGGCWAFAMALSLEKLVYEKIGTQYNLSMQHLIDCNYKNNGCYGGDPAFAAEYARQNGLPLNSEYPFVGQESTCRRTHRTVKFGNKIRPIHEFPIIPRVQYLASKIYIPIAISVDLSFRHLSNTDDVYVPNANLCVTASSHAVTIVNATSEYFEIQNSWSIKWGHFGKKKIKYCAMNVLMGSPSIMFPPILV